MATKGAEDWSDLAAPAAQAASGEDWSDLATPVERNPTPPRKQGSTPSRATLAAGGPRADTMEELKAPQPTGMPSRLDIVLGGMQAGPPRQVLTNPDPIDIGSIIRHPGAALGQLWDRTKESAAANFQDGTLLGVSSKALGRGIGQDPIPRDRLPAPNPARSGLELAADLVGGFVGSAPTPESFIGLPAKAGAAVGRPIITALTGAGLRQAPAKVVARGLTVGAEQAAINAATDPLIQGANIALGDQDKYSLGQTGLNAAFGAVLGAGMGAAGKGLELRGEHKAETARRVDDYIAKRADERTADDWSDLAQPAPSLTTPRLRGDAVANVTAPAAQPAGPAARPAADAAGAGQVGSSPGVDASSARGPTFDRGEHLDENHAALFELGRLAREGTPLEQLNDQAAELARTMGPYMDWGTVDLSPREKGAIRLGAPIASRRMIDAALDYFDSATNDNGLGGSYYDPDLLTDAIRAPKPANRLPGANVVEFPSGRAAEAPPAAPQARVEPADDFPGDWGPVAPEAPPASPTARPATAPDPVDRALDALRAGGKVRVDQGPSLIDFLSKHGINDRDGELANLGGDRWHRDRAFRSRLVKDGGRTLQEAAEAAQDAGYLPRRFSEGESVDTRAQIADLLDAIDGELAGKPRYAKEDIDGLELQQHVDDLDQIINELGIDLDGMTNAEVKAAIDEFFNAPDEGRAYGMKTERTRLANGDADQGLIPGVAPADQTSARIIAELRRRQAARSKGSADAGPLFDETAKAQGDMFDAPAAQPARQPRADLFGDEPSGPLGAPAARQAAPDPNDWTEMAAPVDAPLASSGNNVLRHQPQAKAIAASDPKNVARLAKSVSDLADDLRKTLGLIHRQGRQTLKRALGEYHPRNAVIRTRAMHEIDVLSHEAGHALEFMKRPALTKALRDHAAELRPLAYPGAAVDAQRQEGFAEWFRWYLTNPTVAAEKAPKFSAAFEPALAADNPKALKGLIDIQAAYQAFLKAPSVAVVRSVVVMSGRKTWLKDAAADIDEYGATGAINKWVSDLYTAVLDDLHPIEVATRELLNLYAANTGKKLDLKSAKNPYAISRMSRGAYSTGHVDATSGVVPYHGVEPEGPSLQDAVALAMGKQWTKDAFDDFGAYLTARRMVHEWDRRAEGKLPRDPHLLPKDVWEQAIADYEAANPAWVDAAKMVHEWAANLWKKKFEGGLLTEEAYSRGLTEHPDYVPLMRDISDKERGSGRGVTGNRQFSGGAKAFRGSTRDIINPLQSLMQDAYATAMLLARNDAVGALYDLGNKAGRGSAAIVEKIPAKQQQRFEVDLADALEKIAAELGLSERDMAALTKAAEDAGAGDLAFYKAGEINDMGEPIIFLWRNGKKIALRLPDGQFGRDMFDALTGMNVQAKNVFTETFGLPSRALRLGITSHPAFLAANYVRDQLTTWVLSDVGFKPFLTGARGVVDELAQSGFARLYNSVGGVSGGAGVASLEKGRVDQDIKALNQKGYRFKRFLTFNGLLRASEITETGTRIGVARLAMQQAKKRGYSDYEAAFEGVYTARDLLDWDRRGSKMLSAIRTITFLNAQLQGLDKMRRVAGAEGKSLRLLMQPWAKSEKGMDLTPTELRDLALARKLWLKWGAIGTAGLALTAIYADDAEYQAFTEEVRATHWLFRMPNGVWARIPKPFEHAWMSNVLERGYEAQAKDDPEAWGKMWRGLATTVVPPVAPTALRVPFEVAANRTYAGQPIVPDHLRYSVEPEMQFNSFTSEFSKRLGHELNVSPAVMDHVISGFGGSWARTFLEASNTTLRDKGQLGGGGPADTFVLQRFVQDPTRGSADSKAFWGMVGQSGGDMTVAEGTFREKVKSGKVDEALAYLAEKPAPVRSYVAASILLPGDKKQFHPLIAAQERNRVITDLRRDMSRGQIRAGDLSPITLTPAQRHAADEALAQLALAEMRSALTNSGVKGWEGKTQFEPQEALTRLFAVNPGIFTALNARSVIAGVMPPPVSAAGWKLLRPGLEGTAAHPALIAKLQERASSGRAGAMSLLRSEPQDAQAATQ